MKKLLGLFLVLIVSMAFGPALWAADQAGGGDQKAAVREKPYLIGLGFAFKGGINEWLAFEVRVRGLAKQGSTSEGVQSWEFLPGKEGGYHGWIALEEKVPGKESKEGMLKKYALKIINPAFNAFEADILPVLDEKGNLLADQPAGDKKDGAPVVPIGHLSLRMVRNAFEGTIAIKTESAETSERMPVLLREITMLEEKLESLSINQAVPKDPR